MKDSTKEILFDAWDWCDEEDKSTEFMLQYMADMSGLDYMEVVDFVADDKINQERIERWNRKKSK